MESFATPYPLIFSDGDQEYDKGQIGIHSVLSFKRFQAQLSRLIGLPAGQLSAVFVCRRTSRDVEKRQKLPINENTNFNIILNQHNPSKERDCHFFISLKKSKKERKVARKKNTEAENVDDDDSTSSRGDTSPAGERPHRSVEDDFPSPNSVLQTGSLEADGLSPKPVSVEESNKSDGQRPSDDRPPEPQEELKLVELKVEAKLVAAEGKAVTSAEQENNFAIPPPVTRIGGQPIHRNSVIGEQAKFGPIGTATSAAKLEQQQQQYHYQQQQQQQQLHEVATQARFKDALQPQLVNGRPMVGTVQRINGVPVFSADGSSNMRLLTGGPARGGFSNFQQQVVPNFHNIAQAHFQQGRYMNLQPRFVASRSSASSASDGRPSSMMQHDGGGGGDRFCQDCLSYKERNIRPPPFHCCINDRIITVRGPSPAGPIERPVKRQVKAAA